MAKLITDLFPLPVLVLGLSTLFSANAFAELYRYKGADGEIVIDDNIPPEFIPKGYDILSDNGMVIERVERQKTKKEKAELSEEEKLAEQKRIEAKKQAERDEWLLDRFSDPGDAILARDRQLGALDTLIIVAESQVKKLKKSEEKELAFAASRERAGQEVPEDVLNSIESIRAQVEAAEKQISNHKEEKEKITKKYQSMIDRLKEIEALKNKQRGQ